jgi:hypothetical protein
MTDKLWFPWTIIALEITAGLAVGVVAYFIEWRVGAICAAVFSALLLVSAAIKAVMLLWERPRSG